MNTPPVITTVVIFYTKANGDTGEIEMRTTLAIDDVLADWKQKGGFWTQDIGEKEKVFVPWHQLKSVHIY